MPNHAGTHSSPASRIRDDGGEAEVQQFLDSFARALTSGDTDRIAELWETPSFVVSDPACHAVGAQAEVRKFFEGAKAQYNAMGVNETRPEISVLDWVTERIAIVEVRWPWLDARHHEVGDESSTYILRRDEKGKLRLRVSVMHGTSDAH
jgi:ketosteroid isomerase-like protein